MRVRARHTCSTIRTGAAGAAPIRVSTPDSSLRVVSPPAACSVRFAGRLRLSAVGESHSLSLRHSSTRLHQMSRVRGCSPRRIPRGAGSHDGCHTHPPWFYSVACCARHSHGSRGRRRRCGSGRPRWNRRLGHVLTAVVVDVAADEHAGVVPTLDRQQTWQADVPVSDTIRIDGTLVAHTGVQGDQTRSIDASIGPADESGILPSSVQDLLWARHCGSVGELSKSSRAAQT